MRDFLEKAFHGFGSHFNSTRLQARTNSQTRLVEENESSPRKLSKDQTALIQTNFSDSLSSEIHQSQVQEQLNGQPLLQSALDAQLMHLETDDGLAIDTARSHAVQTEDLMESYHGVTSGGAADASCPSLPLTEQVVAQITDVLKAVREFEHVESSCQSAKEKADIGRTFMKHAAEAQTEEDGPRRDWYLEELEDRKPQIQADIQRHDTLEEMLQTRTRDVNYSRKRLEKLLENVLIEKQLYKTTDAEENFTLPEAMDVEKGMSIRSVNGRTQARASAEGILVDPYRSAYSDVTPPTSEDLRLFGIPTATEVKKRYKAAASNLRLLQGYFDTKEQDREEEIKRYRVAFHNGEVDFSESELEDLLVQQIRELTQNLISAECEFQEALEDYRACGFETEDGMSTTSYREDDEESYNSDPEELAATTAMKDYSRVAAWAEQVTGSQEEDVAQPPEIDRWGDEKSVSISSTFSMVEKELSNRLQIDRWRFYCSTFRTEKEEGGSGDVGRVNEL